jgi:hypothetical protein
VSNSSSLVSAAIIALAGMVTQVQADEPAGVDLCRWYAALDFNQPVDHYSKELTRICQQGEKQDELRELRRIAIEIQRERFLASQQNRTFGSDTTLSRTGLYLIAYELGIFRTG